MTRREKTMAVVAGGFLGVLVLCLGFLGLLKRPAAKLDAECANLRTNIGVLQGRAAVLNGYKTRLQKLTGQTMGGEAELVGRQVSDRLMKLMDVTGLVPDMRVQPTAPAPLKGSREDREIRFSVSGRGSLSNVCDLLYLVNAGPELHRLDDLKITPIGDGSTVSAQFNYTTLVLARPKGSEAPATMPADQQTRPSLNEPQRQRYDIIATRNLFQKYTPPPPVSAKEPKKEPAPVAQAPPPPPSSREGHLKLVGLPTWGGKEEIYVLNASSGHTTCHKVGDDLAGGKIAMVDYRPLPRKDKPELNSPSRIIIAIGREYWAVNLNQNLSERYQLRSSQLPPELKKE